MSFFNNKIISLTILFSSKGSLPVASYSILNKARGESNPFISTIFNLLTKVLAFKLLSFFNCFTISNKLLLNNSFLNLAADSSLIEENKNELKTCTILLCNSLSFSIEIETKPSLVTVFLISSSSEIFVNCFSLSTFLLFSNNNPKLVILWIIVDL